MSRKSRMQEVQAAAAAQEMAARKRRNMILTLVIVLAVVMLGVGTVLLNGWGKDEAQGSGEVPTPVASHQVEIDVKDYGVITAELYGNVAPITVANFAKLAGEGFYDGLTFHRIISGFVIQGGDPNGNGTGGSPDTIKGEFSANGVNNPIAHERGVLSMARSNAPDSASSQFFIMHQAAPHLDGAYAAFGRVLTGMEIVDAICDQTPVTDVNGSVRPENQPVINSIRVTEIQQNETNE